DKIREKLINKMVSLFISISPFLSHLPSLWNIYYIEPLPGGCIYQRRDKAVFFYFSVSDLNRIVKTEKSLCSCKVIMSPFKRKEKMSPHGFRVISLLCRNYLSGGRS